MYVTQGNQGTQCNTTPNHSLINKYQVMGIFHALVLRNKQFRPIGNLTY
ncbi:hypothetical protein C427_4283 [Paraglaciecola psychrophila 170]|uniref:Uncharacterized protein n=1 Tax=Paraglaciecola psychrophila 170 TaxID=1129794 RepID=M4RRU6_9ALTE|nr:hypothetical protein C427_4283 [Paraglaciecola psychrophila 170]